MPFVIAALCSAPVLAAIPAGNHTVFSVALAILGIGFLIFIHELGHFLACRLTKTRVEAFSIGFGPRLFGWERPADGGRRRFTTGSRRLAAADGAFDWRISAIPLGGYVKMAGEVGGDGSPGSISAVRPPKPDEFPQKPFAARAFIICAGVMMNALAAIAFYTIAYGSGLPEMPPVVGAVRSGDAAWAAGMRAGDRFLTYAGEPVRSFEDFANEVVFTKKGAPVEVVVERGGKPVTVLLSPKYEAGIGLQKAGVEPAAEWTFDDGHGGKVTVGVAERVRVSGRAATGGREASALVGLAREMGVDSVKIELPDRAGDSGHDIALPRPTPATKTTPGPQLGVVLQFHTLVIDRVFPGGAAEKAGLRAGDRIVNVDGVTIEGERMLGWLRRIGRIDVDRAGTPTTLEVNVSDPEQTAALVEDLVLVPTKAAVVVPDGSGFPDGKSPAAEAGIRAGDEIVEVGTAKTPLREDLQEAVKSLPPGEVTVKVKSPGQEPREVKVRPKERADPAAYAGALSDSTLIVPQEVIRAANPVDALGMGVKRTVVEVKNIFRMISRFIGGEINPGKTLGGPGTIVNLSSRKANEGLAGFLAFLAVISVNLAVLNILPIPVLDGGSLLRQIVVALRRGRPLKEATIAYVQWAGFALLMLLMVFALKNDVVNLVN